LVFAIASGNNDAHLKNWSLIYPDKIRARWSPLYDQVSTVAWREPARQLALNLAAVKHFGQIDRFAFERFAEEARMDKSTTLKIVEEMLEQLRATWRSIAPSLPLPEEHRIALREHWRKVPLLRSAGSLG
jgi:serine/threonine-protein kinase HipA